MYVAVNDPDLDLNSEVTVEKFRTQYHFVSFVFCRYYIILKAGRLRLQCIANERLRSETVFTVWCVSRNG